MHKIEAYQTSPVDPAISYIQHGEASPQEALERYLMWAEEHVSVLGENYNKIHSNAQSYLDELHSRHKSEVMKAINNPDLKVWIE